MVRIAQVVFIAVMLMAPAAAVAGPAEDANAAVDRWSTAYSGNGPETIAKNYCPDAIFWELSVPLFPRELKQS